MKKKKRRQSSGKRLHREISAEVVMSWMEDEQVRLDKWASQHVNVMGKTTLWIQEGYPISQLRKAHRIVENLIVSTEPGFRIIENEQKNVKTVEPSVLSEYFSLVNGDIEECPLAIEPSEYAQAFFKVFGRQSYIPRINIDKKILLGPLGVNVAEAHNLLIQQIRELAGTTEIKRRLRERAAASVKSFESASAYVNELFTENKKLRIVRLNCFVTSPQKKTIPAKDTKTDCKKEPDPDPAPAPGPKEAKAYLSKLTNYRRSNRLFRGLVGYIWKLDYHFQHGYYFHFIFFFSDAVGIDSHELSSKIGEYWKVILTKGEGAWYAPETKHGSPIWMDFGDVGRKDSALRAELSKLVYYLTMKDQYIKFGTDRSGKRFAHGELKNSNVSDDHDISIRMAR